MSKVSKEFWINGESLEIIEKDLYENIIISRKKGTAKLHKITITYEIDREVTIKESDIDKFFPPEVGFFERDLQIIKQKLFGGVENDVQN